jgi:two-component system, sensor histidine kinase PdtaS
MATPDLPPVDAGASLMLALLITSSTPLVLLDKDLRVVVASTSFGLAFGLDTAKIPGTPFAELGHGAWNVPQLISGLMSATSGNSTIAGYELTLGPKGAPEKHLVLNAHRLEYGDGQDVRVVLSILDVTEAKHGEKLKDNLLREKAVLLQELQHRVANSLQIIASVLMQSASITKSTETKVHLNDAHNRIMSVASLQRQLAQTSSSQVELRLYFNDLCRSIGASMIHDQSMIRIEVTCDNSKTASERSISLGLIVTELVINGLKHAFPNNRKGTITVDYRSAGDEWALTVCDDGIGMPVAGEASKPGLGTSIVEALARQLEADIRVHDGKPGTHVEISHNDVADIAKVPRLVMAV